jgi:NCS1 family nucleobase:cation symporter-1
LRAVAAFIPAAGIAGMLYLIIAKRQPHYADVSGEAIAVDNVSH